MAEDKPIETAQETYKRIAAEVMKTATPAEAKILQRVMNVWHQIEQAPNRPVPEIAQRLGHFAIPEHLVRDHPHAVAYALLGMVITRCEYDYASHTFRYTAMGPQFRLVMLNAMIPHYDLRITINSFDDASIPPCVAINEWQGKR